MRRGERVDGPWQIERDCYGSTVVPHAPFGRTGHQSTRVIFGAAALGRMSQARADATLEIVDAAGINHLDTAASYGESELRLAPFLSDHRSRFFLATKTGERTGAAARAELERSLERLGVTSIVFSAGCVTHVPDGCRTGVFGHQVVVFFVLTEVKDLGNRPDFLVSIDQLISIRAECRETR